MILNEKKGNLFELDPKKYTYAHCISQDCAMGKGIAVVFDKQFRGMKSYCKKVIKENHLNFPCIIPYSDADKMVFNLITKKNYWGKPTYATIEATIEDMAHMCKVYKIKHLAIPKIGCGLDKLQWCRVREIIVQHFKELDITIEVRYL